MTKPCDAAQDAPVLPLGKPFPLLARDADWLQLRYSQSSTFHPTASLDEDSPDTILLSSDHVLFYVHRRRLLSTSTNAFSSLLRRTKVIHFEVPEVISVLEDEATLCAVLNIAYERPASYECASFDALHACVAALRRFGMGTHDLLTPKSAFAERLLAYAPIRAIELYLLAAENGAEGLAVAASAYLLSFPMLRLTDEQVTRMGGHYLLRLFALQSGRKLELRDLAFRPPPVHLLCAPHTQRALAGLWVKATARLAWELDCDIALSRLQALLLEDRDKLACSDCRQILDAHVKKIIKTWSLSGRTI